MQIESMDQDSCFLQYPTSNLNNKTLNKTEKKDNSTEKKFEDLEPIIENCSFISNEIIKIPQMDPNQNFSEYFNSVHGSRRGISNESLVIFFIMKKIGKCEWEIYIFTWKVEFC